VIATVGDRIGTELGRHALACLSFGPQHRRCSNHLNRSISASTLAILFATSNNCGLEYLNWKKFKETSEARIYKTTRQQLEATTAQKTQVERRLDQARAEQKAEQEAQNSKQRLKNVWRQLISL